MPSSQGEHFYAKFKKTAARVLEKPPKLLYNTPGKQNFGGCLCMDKVRFGVIGIGNMGTSHVNWLGKGEVKDAVLTAACDIKPSRLDWVRANFGDVACFEDYHQLLDSGLCDAILIATPHYYHPIIGIDAFKKGIAVLSEKPVGVYVKKVRELIAAADESGLAFGIMYNQRTSPQYQKIREIVQSGELGQLKRCVWIITDWYRTQAYYDSGAWRATWAGEGGGVLLNQAPHNLDLWQWIFGMPKKIRAFCAFGKYHNIEVEDDVTAYAEYENGATSVFITTTGEYPGTNRLEITGSRGKIVYENGKITYWKLAVDERENTFKSDKGFDRIDYEIIDLTQPGGGGPQHKGILQNFTNHILHGEPLLADGREGINMVALANAMMLSTWKNDWVEVDNDGEEFYQHLREKIATSTVKKEGVEAVADLTDSFGT